MAILLKSIRKSDQLRSLIIRIRDDPNMFDLIMQLIDKVEDQGGDPDAILVSMPMIFVVEGQKYFAPKISLN